MIDGWVIDGYITCGVCGAFVDAGFGDPDENGVDVFGSFENFEVRFLRVLFLLFWCVVVLVGRLPSFIVFMNEGVVVVGPCSEHRDGVVSVA